MGRLAVAGVALVLCFGFGLGACAAVVTVATGAPGGDATTTMTAPAAGTPSTVATVGPVALTGRHGKAAVPAAWESIEHAAAATCRGLGWSVLAAVGRVESDSGRSTLPGVASGANAAGAEGPMQFEPSTFVEYAVAGPGGARPPSPYDPVDSMYTAAHMLCANGAGRTGGLYDAVWAYDHTRVYVETVLVLAHALDADPGLGTAPATAIAAAAGKLGVPCPWGGSGQGATGTGATGTGATGTGGDACVGLVRAAYRAAGIALPRAAQAQYDAGPRLSPFTSPMPGDLVFFGGPDGDVSHAGIYIGDGEMIDAARTATAVQVQTTPIAPGEAWGRDVVVGETRPWAA